MLPPRSRLSTISFAFVLFLFQSGVALGAQPKLALVIDDVCGGTWAQSHPVLDIARQIPMALSILPNGEDNCRTRLYKAGIPKDTTIMLHMPMQPKGHEDPGPGALLANDEPAVIRDKLDKALDAVPGAKGLNNHMGSAVTGERAALTSVMGWAKEHGLFYVDSATNVFDACTIAVKHGVRCGRNHVFLDNSTDLYAIAKQLEHARALSLKSGKTTIVIGHPHRQTLAVINSFIKRNRVEFVPIERALPRPAGTGPRLLYR